MIKLEHTVTMSPDQMKFVIEGMHNSMNSCDKSDSDYVNITPTNWNHDNIIHDECEFEVGPNDRELMHRLSVAGTDHRKFMRQMPVMVRITAPLYWWEEFDTYKVGTVANSCGTMHKIADKEFDISDFSTEHLLKEGDKDFTGVPELKPYEIPMDILKNTIKCLNFYRELYLETKDKKYWWQMIQLLPTSYNQTRNVTLNYEVLANIYKSRRKSKLDEWLIFCGWIRNLPCIELITYKPDLDDTLKYASENKED